MAGLKAVLEEKIEPMRARVRELLKVHGHKSISEVTVSQAYGGARGVKCMVTETSALDPMEGIRFRGYPIPALQEKLPRAEGSEDPLPEGMFYLLLTGDLPTQEDVEAVAQEWRKRSGLSDDVKRALDALPIDTHPMTQFSIGIMAMQNDSVQAARYREGINKKDLWDPTFEDAMNLLAKLPSLAAYIYRRTYKGGNHIAPDPNLDWAANFAHMMGVEDPLFKDAMRLYLTLHADHEGGNVSAHTTHLVGSALSDCYQSLSAGLNGLAGPLHGLANQEVLRWIQNVQEELGGGVPSTEQLSTFVWDTLNSGQVIPGYGHAVLRQTDPRYVAFRGFCKKHFPEDELFQIVSGLYEIVPDILKEHGKAKNPWPNVDAHSGVLLVHFGIVEADFYTVLFGISRAMGVLASLVWDRILGLPIERPKSVTTEWLEKHLNG
ncbi:MAG: citrate (Si)-synthase, eukaryotic [Myxococcales bacterium]|nr:citrate (Si)-synthase, eukaryotic [Myxococcales bacterium]